LKHLVGYLKAAGKRLADLREELAETPDEIAKRDAAAERAALEREVDDALARQRDRDREEYERVEAELLGKE